MTICSHIHRNLQHIIQIKKIKKRDLECSCHLYLCSLGGSSQCNASSAAQRIAGQNNNRSILPSIPINVTGCSRTCWYFWNSAFEIIWMILFFGDIQNVFGSIGTGLPVPILPNKQWTVNHIYLCVSCLFFFFYLAPSSGIIKLNCSFASLWHFLFWHCGIFQQLFHSVTTKCYNCFFIRHFRSLHRCPIEEMLLNVPIKAKSPWIMSRHTLDKYFNNDGQSGIEMILHKTIT